MDKTQAIFFLGIGGIGMSALARYFHSQGYPVAGYDKQCTALTQALEAEGIVVVYEEGVSDIPSGFEGPEVLVVRTPAVPLNQMQYLHFQQQGNTFKKRAEVLGMLTQGKLAFAVGGTHGKTTTSSILAQLLHHAGLRPNAFLGGLALNFKSNVLLGDSSLVVVEADEFDRSFLHLDPNYAVITSTDADHLDIYGSEAGILEGFEAFAEKCRRQGKLLVHESVRLKSDFSYGASAENKFYYTNYRVEDGSCKASFHLDGDSIAVAWGLPGKHNMENALAAAALAYLHGLSLEQIAAGLAAFKGVYRRFERVLDGPEGVLIDDYAHHPTEIQAAVAACRCLHPKSFIRVLFQPHLYSRTRDFMEGFQQALGLADGLYLLPIYPARELPIPGVTSQALAQGIQGKPVEVLEYHEAVNRMVSHSNEVLLVLGAGNIDALVPQMKQALIEKHQAHA